MIRRIKIRILDIIVTIGIKLRIPYKILKYPNDAYRRLAE